MSRLHRLSSDELWVYQGGLPLEIVTIAPDGEVLRRVLGDLEELAHRPHHQEPPPTPELSVGPPQGALDLLPQALVPAGSWQGARLAGGRTAGPRRLGARRRVVTPGSDFADFELADPDELIAENPRAAELIRELTYPPAGCPRHHVRLASVESPWSRPGRVIRSPRP